MKILIAHWPGKCFLRGTCEGQADSEGVSLANCILACRSSRDCAAYAWRETPGAESRRTGACQLLDSLAACQQGSSPCPSGSSGVFPGPCVHGLVAHCEHLKLTCPRAHPRAYEGPARTLCCRGSDRFFADCREYERLFFYQHSPCRANCVTCPWGACADAGDRHCAAGSWREGRAAGDRLPRSDKPQPVTPQDCLDLCAARGADSATFYPGGRDSLGRCACTAGTEAVGEEGTGFAGEVTARIGRCLPGKGT